VIAESGDHCWRETSRPGADSDDHEPTPEELALTDMTGRRPHGLEDTAPPDYTRVDYWQPDATPSYPHDDLIGHISVPGPDDAQSKHHHQRALIAALLQDDQSQRHAEAMARLERDETSL
jgi:hypothetical protein